MGTNEIAFISGGASGIGLAAARLLAQKGMKVCIGDKNFGSAESAARAIPGSSAWALDVTDPLEVKEIFSQVERAAGPVSILVTCAGIPGHGPIAGLPDDIWKSVMEVNLSGVFYCMREALKQMLPMSRGIIVTISSVCGIIGCSSSPAYSAAKAGVIGLTKSCARRHAEDGIRANVVAPGLTDTPFIEPDRKMGKLQKGIEKIPMGRMGTPEEIADVIAFLCSSEASFITGQVISPNGGQLI